METKTFAMLFYNISSGIEFSIMMESEVEYERARATLRSMGLIVDEGSAVTAAPPGIEHVVVDDKQLAEFSRLFEQRQ